MPIKEKPKILLVYPPVTIAERYDGILGIFGGKQIPLGIYYLASFVRQHGYEVDAIDAEAKELTEEDTVDMIRQGGFNVLGLSCTTVAFHRSLSLARAVKKAFPNMPIIIGGPHVSSQPDHPASFEEFDYAVRSEGEETLIELLKLIEHGGDPADVPGLAFRNKGEVVVNPAREYKQDLDSLPFPALDLIPDLNIYNPPLFTYKNKPVGNLVTTRGCPYQCTFCDLSSFGRKVRMRSAENVVDEIEILIKKYGMREIWFGDDVFTVNPKRIYEIFDLARKRNLKFSWACMARINTVDYDLLKYMKDNGCWLIAFGIESGSPDILVELKKNLRLSAVEEVVGHCHDLGIMTKGFFMVGHPGETLETMDQTIEFATGIKLDCVTVTINTPLPSTYNYDHAHEFGTLDIGHWEKFNMWSPVFVPHGLTKEILIKKQWEFYRKFYLRPKILLRHAGTLFSSFDAFKSFVFSPLMYILKKRTIPTKAKTQTTLYQEN